MAGTLVANTINTDTGLFSTNNAYLGIAKAWVNYNASSGSAVINASFNVSSITVNGTGDHTINFTTAMPDANYVLNGQTNQNLTTYNRVVQFPWTSAPTTTTARIRTADTGTGAGNNTYNCIVVNGN